MTIIRREKKKPNRIVKFVSELIGQGQRYIQRFYTTHQVNSIEVSEDIGTVKYSYWDKAYHGKAEGLEVSGLLIKPLVNKITAWGFGNSPRVKFDNKEKTRTITKWNERNYHRVVRAVKSSLKLGDSYIFVNPDLTISVIPPSCVFPIVDDQDFSEVIGWKIVREYPHPTGLIDKQVIEEELTFRRGKYQRKRIVKTNQKTISSKTYSLPISRIPFIHIPNNPSENERFGRPEAESMIELLHMYGELLFAASEGNYKQGRPTPTFTKLGTQREIDAFWERHGTMETEEDPDTGETNTYYSIQFDSDRAITLGGNAEFSWESPGSSSKDTETLLGLYFYIYIQSGELPEWVMGNALTGSQASGEVQVDPLVKFIGLKRTDAEPWFKELVNIVIEIASLSDSKMKIDKEDEPKITWPVLTRKDGQLIVQSVQWAHGKGIITNVTALEHLPIEVSDLEEEVQVAQKELEERQQKALEQQLTQTMNEDPSVKSGGIDNDQTTTNANGNKNGPDRSRDRSPARP